VNHAATSALTANRDYRDAVLDVVVSVRPRRTRVRRRPCRIDGELFGWVVTPCRAFPEPNLNRPSGTPEDDAVEPRLLSNLRGSWTNVGNSEMPHARDDARLPQAWAVARVDASLNGRVVRCS
jgi:hypothetical protein